MTGKRTRYSADFKAKVALEALRGELTTAQLAAKHDLVARIIPFSFNILRCARERCFTQIKPILITSAQLKMSCIFAEPISF